MGGKNEDAFSIQIQRHVPVIIRVHDFSGAERLSA